MTVIFFALFGSLFVLTQYLQLVHGYSPLSAGLRALPFALAIGAVSPLSPILAKRFGTRLMIPAGLALMGIGLLDLSTAGVHTAYPPIALAVAIMGAGMGLVVSRSVARRAASWSPPRTAPSSTRWPWACASPAASP